MRTSDRAKYESHVRGLEDLAEILPGAAEVLLAKPIPPGSLFQAVASLHGQLYGTKPTASPFGDDEPDLPGTPPSPLLNPQRPTKGLDAVHAATVRLKAGFLRQGSVEAVRRATVAATAEARDPGKVAERILATLTSQDRRDLHVHLVDQPRLPAGERAAKALLAELQAAGAVSRHVDIDELAASQEWSSLGLLPWSTAVREGLAKVAGRPQLWPGTERPHVRERDLPDTDPTSRRSYESERESVASMLGDY